MVLAPGATVWSGREWLDGQVEVWLGLGPDGSAVQASPAELTVGPADIPVDCLAHRAAGNNLVYCPAAVADSH